MGPLDVLALAGATLVAVALILEAGHFAARSIHARNAAKRQMELARDVREALASTSAIVARVQTDDRPGGLEAAAAEIVVDEVPLPGMEPVGAEIPDEEPVRLAARAQGRPLQAEPESTEPAPPSYYFPLTEPQRRLLQELALGRRPASAGDRLGTEVMLEWLATLGFVRRAEGEADYTITSLGREVVEGTPQTRR